MDELYYETRESDIELITDTDNAFPAVAKSTAATIATAAESAATAMASAAESVAAAMSGIAETMQEIMRSIDLNGLVESLLNALRKVFSQNGINEMLKNVRETMQTIVHNFLQWMMSGLKSICGKISRTALEKKVNLSASSK